MERKKYKVIDCLSFTCGDYPSCVTGYREKTERAGM